MRDIKAGDQDFYRIDKLYSSSATEHPSLNDAIVFDFYSTPSYHSFNNIDYTAFFLALETLPPDATEIETRWNIGSLGRPILSSFLCEKYLLTNQPLGTQERFRYEELSQHGNIHTYRNPSSLPFGLFFDKTVPRKLFQQLSASGKELLLFQAAVLNGNTGQAGKTPSDLNELLNWVETAPLSQLIEARKKSAFRLERFDQNHIEGKISCLTNGFLVFQTAFDAGWRLRVDGAVVAARRINIGLLGVPLAVGEHTVTLRYLPPLLWIGLTITGISLLALVFARWRWPRIKPLKA